MECHFDDAKRLIRSVPYIGNKAIAPSVLAQDQNDFPKLAKAFADHNFRDIGCVLVQKDVTFAPNFWTVLSSIPIGKTLSYSEFTSELGLKPSMVRVVANQLGQNPHILINPCHRVIRSDGSLGGFRWGLELKIRLLALERELNFR